MTRRRTMSLLPSVFSSLRQRVAKNRPSRQGTSRSTQRSLRIESCESRNLLAAVSGTIFDDLGGDGFTADDGPLGGVTVELYQDIDGNRQLSETVDHFIAQTTSDPTDGSYTFDVATDGRYLVRQIAPAAARQTAGPASYAFDVIDGRVFSADTQIIDGFSAPNPADRHMIAGLDPGNPTPNPLTLVENHDSILGGQRDLMIEVLDDPGFTSATVQVGEGIFDFGTMLVGTRAVVQYGQGGAADLTIDGANNGLRIDFVGTVNSGSGPEVPLQIRATSSGGSAELIDAIPNFVTSHFVPFSAFTTTGNFSFDDLQQIEFEFNHEGVLNVDLIIDEISAVEENPTGFDFGNFTTIISGTKFDDILGDGFTGDDTPLAGVTIELFVDTNGNETFDEGIDSAAAAPAVTDAQGRYYFGGPSVGDPAAPGLADGLYFIREQVPTGSLQTAGPAYYTVRVIDGRVYADDGTVIDGFDAPTPADRHTIVGADPGNPTPNPLPLMHQDATILGGQRDILVEVLESPGFTSATIQVGEGVFDFGTMLEGTRAVVEYGQGGTGGLTLDADSNGLRIDFVGQVNSGSADTVSLRIEAVGPGGSAAVVREIPNFATSHYVPFSAFAGFSFDDLQQISFEFNQEGIPNVDLIIDAISAVNLKPSGYDFGNFTPNPAVDIEKATNGDDADAPTGPIVPVGSTVTWTYEVKNPGNMALANVSIKDDNGTPGDTTDDFVPTYVGGDTNGDGLLDLDETWQYGATLVATAGPHASNVSVVGSPVDVEGNSIEWVADVTDEDPTNHFAAQPVIDIEKATNGDDADTPTGPIVPVGSTVTWTYEVKNLGNVALDVVSVADDNGTPADPNDNFLLTLVDGDDNGNGLLDVGETWKYETTRVATAGQLVSNAYVIGAPVDSDGNALVGIDDVTDADPTHHFGAQAVVDIEKATNSEDADTPTGPIVPVGSTVTWTYEVTAQGNAPLKDVAIVDDNGTPGDTTDDFAPTFIGGDTDGDGLLDVGETWQYEATLPAVLGQHASLASVVGTPIVSDGEVTEELDDVTDADPTHHFGAQAAIDIEKATNSEDADTPTGPIVPVGSTVTWTYEVTAQGNAPLKDVAIVDDNGTPGDTTDDFAPTFIGGDTDGDGLLDVGETWQYEATLPAVLGQHASLASVVGTPIVSDGEVTEELDDVTDADPTHHFGAQAAIDIEKATNGEDADTPTGPIVPVGSTVTWTYEVTNPGNMPLADVTVTDDSGVVLTNPADANGLLDSGETWQYTTTLPAAIGQQTSLASVVGTPVGSDNEPIDGIDNVTDQDPTHHFGADAAIDIEKATNGDDADTPMGPIVPVGSTVTWTYEVTNPGNMPLADVTVTDDSGVVLTNPADANGLLDPGETWQYTTTLPSAIGQQASLASVVGTPVDSEGEPIDAVADVTDQDPTHHFGAQAAVDIEKATNGDDADTPTGPIVPAVGTVTWTYDVTMLGNAPLANVTVTDDNGTPSDPTDDFQPAFVGGDTNGDGRLDAGETWQYEATLPAGLGQHASLASVVGTPVVTDGEITVELDDVADDDPTHHFGANAAIDIEKATNGDDADTPTGPIVPVGNKVTWTYEVTNPGNLPLADVTVTDDSGVVLTNPTDANGLLDPGETWQYTTKVPVVIGQQASLVSVVGTPVDGDGQSINGIADVMDEDPTHHFGVEAVINVEKSTNGVKGWSPKDGTVHVLADTLAGNTVTWTYEVTNGGNVALKGVTLIDDNGTPADPTDDFLPKLMDGDTDGDGQLDVDETWHYMASGKAVLGTYTNVVLATGTPVWTDGNLINGLSDVSDDAASGYKAEDPRTASLSGFVYLDRNDDGIMSPTEPPLPGAIITLDGLDLGKNPVHRTTITDANGYYEFTDLPGGTYTLRETQPTAYLDGKDTAGTPTGVVTNDLISDIDLPIGFAGELQNFGELGLKPEIVSKRLMVYPIGHLEDFDGSGILPPEYSTAIEGTAGDDLFEFSAGMEPGSLRLTVNGTEVPIEAHIGAVHLDGLGGNDTVILTGTDGTEALSLGPDFAIMVSSYFAVSAVNVESISVDSLGGDDRATLYDSPGNDTLKAWPGYALLYSNEFSHTVIGFESLLCATSGVGIDQALLYDSPGDDLLSATPTGATLSGEGFEIKAMYFDGVHAYATAGGIDVAKFFDSPGNDEYVGKPDYTALFGDGFYNRAKFFEGVHGYATAGGVDVARMYDSPGDDLFVADPTQGALFGDGYYNRAKSFEAVHAFGTAGGFDSARLYDSAGDDHFVLRPEDGALFGDQFYNRAKFFEAIEANATAGGQDNAAYQPVGDSHLEAADDWARLTWGGRFAWLTEFEQVKAESSGDGNDTKHVEAVDYLLLTEGPWLDT